MSEAHGLCPVRVLMAQGQADSLAGVDGKVKAAFTREYNQGEHAVRSSIMLPDAGPKRKKRGGGGGEGGGSGAGVDNDVVAANDGVPDAEDASGDEDEERATSIAGVKQSKAKAKGKTKVAGGGRGRGRGRGRGK
eukprot:scaffold106_cov380-Prasinococcus_capsulatus_cf.AAC.14